jgi:hypothetical protein
MSDSKDGLSIIDPKSLDIGELNLITSKELAKSGTLYVVMDKNKSTVVASPGGLPFSTTNLKAAEAVAREMDGLVVPAREAVKLVLNNPINW